MLQALHTKFGKDWANKSSEKNLTHDDGHQPILIGHLSDSGDLKSFVGNHLKIGVD